MQDAQAGRGLNSSVIYMGDMKGPNLQSKWQHPPLRGLAEFGRGCHHSSSAKVPNK